MWSKKIGEYKVSIAEQFRSTPRYRAVAETDSGCRREVLIEDVSYQKVMRKLWNSGGAGHSRTSPRVEEPSRIIIEKKVEEVKIPVEDLEDCVYINPDDYDSSSVWKRVDKK